MVNQANYSAQQSGTNLAVDAVDQQLWSPCHLPRCSFFQVKTSLSLNFIELVFVPNSFSN